MSTRRHFLIALKHCSWRPEQCCELQQGINGLGMMRIASPFPHGDEGQLAGEFIEVESGRKDNRPSFSPPLRM
jgi:hypothetical protein